MGEAPFVSALTPPLVTDWQAATAMSTLVASGKTLYGISTSGRVSSINPLSGQLNWSTTNIYLNRRLTVAGTDLFAFRKSVGLVHLTDTGPSFAERVLVSVNPMEENGTVSDVVVDTATNLLLFISQEALLCVTRAGVLATGASAGPETPHTLYPVSPGRVLSVDGYGFPSLWTVTANSITRVWRATVPGLGPERDTRCALTNNGRVYCAQEQGICCVDLASGSVLWRNMNVKAKAFATDGARLFAVGPSAYLWALDMASGAIVWERAYLYETTTADFVGAVATSANMLYVGAILASGQAYLMAVNATTGAFTWEANSAKLRYGSGLPCLLEDRIISFGSSQPPAAMRSLTTTPAISDLSWAPNPLRGEATAFAGKLRFTFERSAVVSVAAWRETSGKGSLVWNDRRVSQGTSEFDWNAGDASGFTSGRQFGRIAVDVVEDSGAAYTLTQLVPVNTLPDIQHHWAKNSVEAMLYHQFISGYPDLTFKPDNLLTRAESSTIIAKTLGLSGPAPGFQSKFTDLASHWAREFIFALEERNIVGGFLEPDGTYTFRPDLTMTRAQEARILVRAYAIALAPSGFQSKFTDISGHWAEPDIKALEAAGYVNGFQEPNGTYTYRPEQNLTRSELCALGVRILRLSPP